MNTKSNIRFIALASALTLLAEPAKSITIYDNNISALNINALTDVFMSYVNYGDNMFDLFEEPVVYGKMRRVDEYGDDGSTLPSVYSSNPISSSLDNIWINANHFNSDMHYGNKITEHARFNLASAGLATKNMELKHGFISFGGFVSYINSKLPEIKSNGYTVGLFSHYKYNMFGARALVDIGSLDNKDSGIKYDNSWFNIATDIYANLKIDDTFYAKPSLYLGYALVLSDTIYVDGDKVTSSDYNFFNIAPGISFIKEIVPNWYGALSGKYVTHFGGKNNIHVNGTSQDELYLDSHTDIGIDIEYRFKHFVFGGKVHAMIGDIDGWNSNLNIKYVF